MKRDITKILRKDQEKLSTNKKFVEANRKQYELAIDTWLEMFPEHFTPTVIQYMEENGLVETISYFSAVADDWLRILRDPSWAQSEERNPQYDAIRGQLWSGGLKGFLQVCRYLKRFQPIYADKLLTTTLSQFKTTLNIAKMHNRKDLSGPNYLSQILDHAGGLADMLMGFVPTKNEYFEYGRMTPGKDPTDIKPIAQKWARARFERLEDRPFATTLCLPLLPGKVRTDCVANLPSCKKVRIRVLQGHVAFERNGHFWIHKSPILLNDHTDLYEEYDKRAKEMLQSAAVDRSELFIFGGQVRSHATGIYGSIIEVVDYVDISDATAYYLTDYLPLDAQNIYELIKEEKLPIRFGNTIENVAYYMATVEIVPKNSKTGRVIAREDPTRQWCLSAIREKTYVNMYRVRDELCEELWEYFDTTNFPLPVDPERESPSQIRAFLGSVGEKCATIDWSSASDLLSYKLVQRIMPKSHFRERLRYRAQYLNIKGIVYVNHFWSTMGAANTWADMSIVLWCICVAASEAAGRLCDYKDLIVPVLWGDDTIVDVRVAEFVVDVLETLGMRCNREKSYWSGSYREACGAEYFDGRDVSTVYWPRRAMLYDDAHRAETYAMLLDLQHRLWDYPTVVTRITRDLQDIAGDSFMSCLPLDDWSLPWSVMPSRPKRVSNPNYLREGLTQQELSKLEADYVVLKTVVEPEAPRVPSDLHTNPTYRNYLMYKYYEYLRFGPKLSDDPLMRSLGLTMSRIAGGDFGGEKPLLSTKLKFE